MFGNVTPKRALREPLLWLFDVVTTAVLVGLYLAAY